MFLLQMQLGWSMIRKERGDLELGNLPQEVTHVDQVEDKRQEQEEELMSVGKQLDAWVESSWIHWLILMIVLMTEVALELEKLIKSIYS